MRKELPLRDYQAEAIEKIVEAWRAGIARPAVVLPTGAGKTVIFSHLAKDLAGKGAPVVILVHRDELVRQTVAKLHAVAPHLTVGVVKAGENDVHADVIVASVQTLRRPARLVQIPRPAAVIVDECHHAAADSYLSVLDGLGSFATTGWTPTVGFTATLDREKDGRSKTTLADVWDKVVYQRDILDMISEGYLVDVSARMVTIDGMSLSEAKIVRGDFSETSLTDLLLDHDAQRIVAEAYVEHAKDRKGLVFTPTVRAAREFAKAFETAGVTTAVVHGDMPTADRHAVLRDFSTGKVQVLVNCMVLTEGYDQPDASCVVIARPTRSASLYVQMVGRVLRPFPGKADALVLDVVGATEDHTLATLADLSSGRVDTVEPGETLTGAARRLAKKGHPGLAGYAVGTKAVNLFDKSRTLWLRTNAGVWFVSTGCSAGEACEWAPGGGRPCKGHLVFLWPGREFGTYRVGIRPTYSSGGRWVTPEDLDLQTAMSWGEQAVADTDTAYATSKKASWRKRADAPTPAQLRYAARLGIKVPDGVTKAGLSDLINITVASRVLDPKLPKNR